MEKRCPYKDHNCVHGQAFGDGYGGNILHCTYTKDDCDEKEHGKLSEESIREMSRAI